MKGPAFWAAVEFTSGPSPIQGDVSYLIHMDASYLPPTESVLSFLLLFH